MENEDDYDVHNDDDDHDDDDDNHNDDNHNDDDNHNVCFIGLYLNLYYTTTKRIQR